MVVWITKGPLESAFHFTSTGQLLEENRGVERKPLVLITRPLKDSKYIFTTESENKIHQEGRPVAHRRL